MGGEGSMASAILSLKQNRALLKKRSLRDIKSLLQERSGKTELEFKTIPPEALALIKAQIRREAKKELRREILRYLISFLILWMLGYVLYRFLFT